MLKDGNSFRKIYIACGYTDLRYGVDGLACTIQEVFRLDPYDEGTLFLFCGRRTDRLKGLLWDGDGFLLLYKRLANGRFQWLRSSSELKAMTPEQYHNLMTGFAIELGDNRYTKRSRSQCRHLFHRRNSQGKRIKTVSILQLSAGRTSKDHQ